MRAPVIAVTLLCAAASAAHARQADPVAERLENSPRHHEWADIASANGRTVRTWVVYPEVGEPAASVVIIHENRGLNDWARAVADHVAELGYVALAPDLLTGAGPDGGGTSSFATTDDARNAIYELTNEQVMADLDAVVAHARSLDATNDTVMVGGFCWGGSRTFLYATHNSDVVAFFVFYGGAPDESSMENITHPVYGFYGGDDFRITSEIPKVTDAMARLNKSYEPEIYEGAGHGFMRSGEASGASDANRLAMEHAWIRWATLLQWESSGGEAGDTGD
jgi:carboxymethylenebutenolidase